MSYATDLAKEFKNRTNVKRTGNLKGKILSLEPLKIGILNNTVFLQKGNCSICSSLKENYSRNATINGGTTSSIIFKDILKVGDNVLVISDALGQYFFIVDKIEVI
jgi:hypothetical protein